MFGLFKNVYKAAWNNEVDFVMSRVSRDASLLGGIHRKTNCSLLDIATIKLDIKFVRRLLDAGADPSFTGGGSTPLHSATNHSWLHLPAYRTKENMTELVAIARLLIERGADVNAMQSSDDCTPIAAAIKHNWAEMVKLLLKNGANVHWPNFNPSKPSVQKTDYQYCAWQPCDNEVRIMVRDKLRHQFNWDLH